MNATIRHDMARKLAYELVEMIASCLRQEEQLEALREFYAVIRAGLDEYDAKDAKDHNQPYTRDGADLTGNNERPPRDATSHVPKV